VILLRKIFQRVGKDPGPARYEDSPNVSHRRRARVGIHFATTVEINAYNSAFFLEGNFNLPAHIFEFVARIIAYQERKCTRHIYTLTAFAFDKASSSDLSATSS